MHSKSKLSEVALLEAFNMFRASQYQCKQYVCYELAVS